MAPHADAIAAEVRARRAFLRLRQDEVADLAGVSERFVYALEHGKQTAQLDKVIAVLGVLGLRLEVHNDVPDDVASDERR